MKSEMMVELAAVCILGMIGWFLYDMGHETGRKKAEAEAFHRSVTESNTRMQSEEIKNYQKWVERSLDKVFTRLEKLEEPKVEKK